MQERTRTNAEAEEQKTNSWKEANVSPVWQADTSMEFSISQGWEAAKRRGTSKHSLWDRDLACWRMPVSLLQHEGAWGPFLPRFTYSVCSGWQVTLQCCWKQGWRWSRPSSTTCCPPSWPMLAWWLARPWASTQRTSPAGSSPSRPACSFMWLWWIWWVGLDLPGGEEAQKMGDIWIQAIPRYSDRHDSVWRFVYSCRKCFTGTARTTSAASWDTSSCRTWACSPASPSCYSSPSSRTKSFLILDFRPGGECGEVLRKVKEGQFRCVGIFVGLVLGLQYQWPLSCMHCESRLWAAPPFRTSCESWTLSPLCLWRLHFAPPPAVNMSTHCEAHKKRQ